MTIERHKSIGVKRTRDFKVFTTLVHESGYAITEQSEEDNLTATNDKGEPVAYWETINDVLGVGYVAASPQDYKKWSDDLADESVWIRLANEERPTCSECGSGNIDIRTISRYDEELAMIVSETNIDVDHCYDCDASAVEIKWVEASNDK